MSYTINSVGILSNKSILLETVVIDILCSKLELEMNRLRFQKIYQELHCHDPKTSRITIMFLHYFCFHTSPPPLCALSMDNTNRKDGQHSSLLNIPTHDWHKETNAFDNKQQNRTEQNIGDSSDPVRHFSPAYLGIILPRCRIDIYCRKWIQATAVLRNSSQHWHMGCFVPVT